MKHGTQVSISNHNHPFISESCNLNIIVCKIKIDYYLFCYGTNRINWQTSENYCSRYISTHLASFSSSDDIESFETLKENINSYDHTWIGLFREDSSSNWEWIDGYDGSFTQWDSSDSVDSSELCAETSGYGNVWYAETCDTYTDCFVCNMPDCM